MHMQNNPYDDFLKNLAKLVEEIIKNMPEKDSARFVGCTIITGNISENPDIFHINNKGDEDLDYELIETEDRIFITADLPRGYSAVAYAEINPETVYIIVDDERTAIELPDRVDLIHSFYQVRHGVMDIILKKAVKKSVRIE